MDKVQLQGKDTDILYRYCTDNHISFETEQLHSSVVFGFQSKYSRDIALIVSGIGECICFMFAEPHRRITSCEFKPPKKAEDLVVEMATHKFCDCGMDEGHKGPHQCQICGENHTYDECKYSEDDIPCKMGTLDNDNCEVIECNCPGHTVGFDCNCGKKGLSEAEIVTYPDGNWYCHECHNNKQICELIEAAGFDETGDLKTMKGES